MTITEELDHLCQRLGHSIVLPIPPLCQALVKQAKAAGIPVGSLFVLSRPLVPEICGSYDRASGDLWCHYDGGDNNGAREVVQCMLTLIASIKLNQSASTTLEQDWEAIQAAHREAFALAEQWGYASHFSASDLNTLLAVDHHHYRCHVAAGELAGNLRPAVARNVYLALLEIRRRYQWSDRLFEAALNGMVEENEEANAAVVDFDRTRLRSRWLCSRTQLHSQRGDNDLNPFGIFACILSPQSAEILRTALEKTAYPRPEQDAFKAPIRGKDLSLQFFFRVECAQDLSLLIEQVNPWLVDDHLECYAQVNWTLYADQAAHGARLYHLNVTYHESDEHSSSEPRDRQGWVLFPSPSRHKSVEAAWQRYIRSWFALENLRDEPLSLGLHALWSRF